MPPAPRQPLHLESVQGDRVVVLGCETCRVTVHVGTSDGMFAATVQAFFARHGGCAASLDLG